MMLSEAAEVLAQEWLNNHPDNQIELRTAITLAEAEWQQQSKDMGPAPIGWIGGRVADMLERLWPGVAELYDVCDRISTLTDNKMTPNYAVTDALGTWARGVELRPL